jgi:hypothetical protein
MKNTSKGARRIEYDGEHKIDSLVIGNYGDVELIVKGTFELSGLIYSRKTVELTIMGNGFVRFSGYCKKVIIHLVKGNCILDLSGLSSKEVCCFSLRDTSRILIGPTKVISRANVQDQAIFNYHSSPLLRSYSIVGNARIERLAS